MRQRHPQGDYVSPSSAPAEHSHHHPAELAAEADDDHDHHQREQQLTLDQLSSSWTYCIDSAVLAVMDRVPYNISSHFFPTMTPAYASVLSMLSENYVKPYNAANSAHRALLERLWHGFNRITFTDVPFASQHPRWKEMGFQSEDPTTDFRGAGLFSLSQLVYLIEKHPRQWSSTLEEPDFLTAAAGINVSMRLITLLQISREVSIQTAQFRSGYSAAHAKAQICRFIISSSGGGDVREDERHAVVAFRRLCEVFCTVMRLLLARWNQSSKNIMEFNQLLSGVYADSERMLYACGSLEAFCALV